MLGGGGGEGRGIRVKEREAGEKETYLERDTQHTEKQRNERKNFRSNMNLN